MIHPLYILVFVSVPVDDAAEGKEGDGGPVQESSEALGQALRQGEQVQAGLPQRLQEREDRAQPRTKRQRRQLAIARPGQDQLHYFEI